MLARPVAFAPSRTVTVAVRLPLSGADVGQASETGPLMVVVVLVIVLVPTLSVYVLEPAAAFSIHTVNHTVPLTVAPLAGGVVKNPVVSPPPPPPGVTVDGRGARGRP